MPDSDRVSIWSIAGDWLTVFYILFSIEVAAIVALVGWREIFLKTWDTPIDTILAIGAGAAPNIFTAAAINIAVIFQAEVIRMLAERYLRHRYEVGKKDGQAVGKRLAEKERARHRKYAVRLRAWNERRLNADANGEPFDEPMPEYNDAEYDNEYEDTE